MQPPIAVRVRGTQDFHCKAVELEGIKIGRGQRTQKLEREVTGLGSSEGVHGRSTINPDTVSLAVLVNDQLSGVAGGTRDIEKGRPEIRVVVTGEAHRQ